MGLGGGSSAGDYAQAQYNQQQSAIQQGLKQIDTTFSGFTPQFFNQRQQDYQNYAIPQLQQQFQQQSQNLGYGLGNQGLLNSSAGSSLTAGLGQQYQAGQQAVANQGQQQAQQLQQQVANTRSSLTGQLEASANPAATAGQAINFASQYSAPSAFSPVGNLFQNWANIYGANSLAGAGTPSGSAGAGTPLNYFLGRSNTSGLGTTPTSILG